MRFIKSLTILAAACLTISFSFAQTADEIISKHVDAIGGADNWKKVNSMVVEGSMSMQGNEIAVTRTVVHGKGFKNEISVMGISGYQILTPTEGWNYMPFAGQTAPEAMNAEELKEGQNEFDAQGAVIDYASKGHTIEYIGKEEVDGSECYKIKMTFKTGKHETLFIDPSSFYIVKSTTLQKVNGEELEVAKSYTNYEKLPEGIVLAKSISLPLGSGMNVDLTVSKVEVNKPIDPSVFTPSK